MTYIRNLQWNVKRFGEGSGFLFLLICFKDPSSCNLDNKGSSYYCSSYELPILLPIPSLINISLFDKGKNQSLPLTPTALTYKTPLAPTYTPPQTNSRLIV